MTGILLPSEHYSHDVEEGRIQRDPSQEKSVALLDNLTQELSVYSRAQDSLLGTIRRYCLPKIPPQGVYLWGDVGRGKTYLMDLFFHNLKTERKERLHFHRFMQWVHSELKAMQALSQKNPLQAIAKAYSERVDILCFDELTVTDVTDAMILAELFSQLFARGIAFCVTSNIVPDNLYRNGVHRERFLPAIELLNTHTTVLHLAGPVDYRLRSLEQAGLWIIPADLEREKSLKARLLSLVSESPQFNSQMVLNGHTLALKGETADVIWCEFSVLCEEARSQADYIELAKVYHAVLISNIPQLDSESEAAARRFINLIDEFYDRRVKLIASAEVEIPALYTGRLLQFEFERTKSRLIEMQTHEYLAQAHKP